MNPWLRVSPPGLLVAFCGLDGSGKTTQSRLLAARLEGRRTVFLTRSISDAILGDSTAREFVDQAPPDREAGYLPELALHLAADRLKLMRTELRPRLQSGQVVILDRYIYGSYAQTMARGLMDISWLTSINRYLPHPDLTIYLDIEPEIALSRIRARGDEPRWEETDLSMAGTVRRIFLEQPWGSIPNYYILNGSMSPDALSDRAAALVEESFQKITDHRG